jgi:hypothetical protein
MVGVSCHRWPQKRKKQRHVATADRRKMMVERGGLDNRLRPSNRHARTTWGGHSRVN